MNAEALKQKREKRNVYLRKYRAERKAKGLCFACVQPATSGLYCEKHRESSRNIGARRYSTRKADMLCVKCGHPAVSMCYCKKHLEVVNRLSRLKKDKYKESGRCPSCGRLRWDDKRCVHCLETKANWRIKNNW